MTARWWLIGLGLALLIAVLSPMASPYPDGLERVAEDHAFADKAEGAWYEIMPDYSLPGVGSESLSTVLAGVVGTLLMFGIMFGLGRYLSGRTSARG